MSTLTIKLPEGLKQRLELEAKHTGRSVSALVREAVTARLAADPSPTSLFDRTRDLCGAGDSGCPDLATNPEHLRGFGE